MENKYTRVTCVVCGTKRQTFKSEMQEITGRGTLHGWYSLQIEQCISPSQYLPGGSKWGVCSIKCLAKAHEMVVPDSEKRDPKYRPIEEITQWECDICDKTEDYDSLQRIVGGGATFARWTEIVYKQVQGGTFHHRDEPDPYNGTWHACSDKCKVDLLSKLSDGTMKRKLKEIDNPWSGMVIKLLPETLAKLGSNP